MPALSAAEVALQCRAEVALQCRAEVTAKERKGTGKEAFENILRNTERKCIHRSVYFFEGGLMVATTLDMRYRTRELLASLNRGVSVIITYRGKKAGILSPYKMDEKMAYSSVREHPFFASDPACARTVDSVMDSLRGGRCNDICGHSA